MKNKKWFYALMFILLVSNVSACALSPEPLPSPLPTVLPTPEPSPTMPHMEALDPTGCEVHLWHSLSAEKEAVLLAIASEFQISNPYGVRLRIEYHSPLHKEVWAAIAAGTPPDLVITSCDQVAEYARANAVIPLTEYLDNTPYGLSQEEREDLWPIALESSCRSTQAEHPLGLFFDAHAVVMFYNATWLKKLKADAPPQTWEEFRERCNAARDKKSATWGYAYAADGPVVVNWISSLGEALIDPRSGEALLDSPQAVAALSVLRDLLQDGCAYCAFDPDTVQADFAAEKVLFAFGSTADLSQYAQAILNPKTKKLKFTWSIAPVPYLTEEPLVTVQGSMLSILRTTPQQQLAAWLFLKWFLQRENDVQWARSCGALPLHKSSLEVPEMKDYLAQSPQYELACQLMAYAQAEPAVPKWQEIRELLVQAATMVCQGKADPAEALAAADVAADNLLAR
ncbi:MAG: extracellular solute-binding protein [Chloroflexi bacterium]|nr:extracellular solute-binding protein [Chloroflexota bacterium]